MPSCFAANYAHVLPRLGCFIRICSFDICLVLPIIPTSYSFRRCGSFWRDFFLSQSQHLLLMNCLRKMTRKMFILSYFRYVGHLFLSCLTSFPSSCCVLLLVSMYGVLCLEYNPSVYFYIYQIHLSIFLSGDIFPSIQPSAFIQSSILRSIHRHYLYHTMYFARYACPIPKANVYVSFTWVG